MSRFAEELPLTTFSTDLRFGLANPEGVDEAALQAMYERFKNMSKIGSSFEGLQATRSATEPTLGMLDEHFLATDGLDRISLNVLPMGATRHVMLGCFSVRSLHPDSPAHIRGREIDILGINTVVGDMAVGYAAIKRADGILDSDNPWPFAGYLAIFDTAPSSAQLSDFVQNVSGDYVRAWHPARPDLCVAPNPALKLE